ncbi:hypothetical protein BDV96DRAFT_347948 [Lophiotrema nucula]|uniref:Short chain dehydrogenase n=1 Tax=Lophiotrema nucula TaxID=690887 RepID=A0A6A5ZKZ1_9PLEO|nr:hypothetical protein BDV96DRAFT_347948 [Lophiotrema nucula]
MASPKIVFITGGNNGIGYEAVKALLQSPQSYHVFMGSRSIERGQSAIEHLKKEVPGTQNTVELVQVDLISDSSIENAFKQISTSHAKLDILINNAGTTFDIEHLRGTATLRDSFTKTYDVNVAGTNVLTHTFAPLLLKSSDPRLLFIGGLSMLTQAADLSQPYWPIPAPPAGWPKPTPNPQFSVIGYRCSKVALNMLMLDWYWKLSADGVKVWCVQPGMLATDFAGSKELAIEMGAGHPREGGDIIRRVVEGERDGDVGRFVEKDGGFVAW